MALLVALVSVISLSIPIIKQASETKDSEIRVNYQGAIKDKAYFLITNTGTRAGTIKNIKLIISTPVEDFGNDDRVAYLFDAPPIAISAGKTEIITADLAGRAREIIDSNIYRMWKNNIAEKPIKLPTLRFRVSDITFEDGTLRETTFTPKLNDLLLAGPSEWYKCAGSIAWSDWNGPTSNFFPEDIDPELVEAWCGKLPSTFQSEAKGQLPPPKPNALLP